MSVNPIDIVLDKAAIAFGPRPVFSDMSVTFPASRVTALVGPSGSGKSTLLAAIAGQHPLTSGSINYRDILTGNLGPPDAAKTSWVPQGSNALSRRSVLDNVAVAALSSGSTIAEAHQRAVDAIEMVGLAWALQQQARRLSGGELQRVALARALASGKEVILADEPSANLDAANTALIASILDGLSVASTIVVATHDPVMVSAATSAVHMRDRQIRA